MSVLVLGDLIVDEYLMGDSTRLSPESPVPVITNLQKKTQAGGAANVALNLMAMGSATKLITQADSNFDTDLISGLDFTLIPCNQTPTKTRVLANNHVVCRLDTERFQQVTASTNWFQPKPNVCVLSDYNKGFLHDSNNIINWCKERNILTIVDPKKSWEFYKGSWLIKANYQELVDQVKVPVELDNLSTVCGDIAKLYDIENLVITLGSKGLFVFTRSKSQFFPAAHDQVIDVTGAGDVVIAAVAHYVNQGLDLISAAERANKLAGISVTHPGCYIITQQDLSIVEDVVVFTNGCFDILHRGHIEYLRKSKSYGTKLIVGLNSDRSVRDLKGLTRPINNEQDRKAMLESLEFVDEVVIFDETTPRELILRIKPDIITKGGDYTVDTVVGHDLVNQVIIVPIVEGYSSTGLINKL